MHEFDDVVLKKFVKKQSRLFSEPVASNIEEAEAFLEESMAVVVSSIAEVWQYFKDEGMDLEAADDEELLEMPEIFDIGDGRYLIVEG